MQLYTCVALQRLRILSCSLHVAFIYICSATIILCHFRQDFFQHFASQSRQIAAVNDKCCTIVEVWMSYDKEPRDATWSIMNF